MRIAGSGFSGGLAKRHPKYPRERRMRSGLAKRHPKYYQGQSPKGYGWEPPGQVRGIGKRHPKYPHERRMRSGMGISWPETPDWLEDLLEGEAPGWYPKDWWWPGGGETVIDPPADPTASESVRIQVTVLRSQAAVLFGQGKLTGEEFSSINDKLSTAAVLAPHEARILLSEVAAFLSKRKMTGGGALAPAGGLGLPWWAWALLIAGGGWAAYRYL